VGFVRRHPLLSGLAVLALAAFTLIAITAVAVWRAAHTDDARRVDSVDVIVVLGAAEYNGTPSPVFAGRLQQAALLYREGRADRVVVLGGKQEGDVTSEGEAGREYLIESGLPATAVAAVSQGHTTYQSLEAAVKYMDGPAVPWAVLVSDPWHNLRIKRMASDLGIRAYASATWHSAARSQMTRLAGYTRETFAYLYYRLFGG